MPETALEKAKRELKNGIYKVASDILEKHEREGRIHGNGHHAAQKIAEDAGIELVLRWIDGQEAKDE